jgi:signal transduction histidine kinase
MISITLKSFLKEFMLLIVILIIMLISIFSYFTYEYNKSINYYLEDLSKQYEQQYNITYNDFYKLSQNTFYGIINKPEIYDLVKHAHKKDEKTQAFYRQVLYDKLLSDYNRLLDFKFNQMHFHFSDNISFLRMHKPDKFGDDLNNLRFSVAEVNKTLKPLDGYEIGKLVDGFRFIYPLFDESLFHVGSVELSVESDFFDKNFEHNFGSDAHFLVKKSSAEGKMLPEIIKKYNVSFENDKYIYFENSDTELLHYTDSEFYSLDEKKLISSKMENGEKISFYKKYKGKYLAIYFLPIPDIEGNKNSAYMVLYKHSDLIEQVNYNYYKMIFILVLFTLLFILYMKYRYKQMLEDKNNEYILFQQTKMVALGEMIQNISHQWRQPLSVISMSASGLKLKKQCGILEDKEFYDNLDGILRNTVYLSQTIEDFRNYFDESLEKTNFNLKNTLTHCIDMFKEELNVNDIVVIENIDDIELYTYEQKLKQVLINLLKNAKDFTKEGVIIINANEKKNEIRIEIQDSAGGIPENIIEKIFEPYFTTKHNSFGMGLGLFSSYEIINNEFKGNIFVENREFNYNFKTYKGACFSIVLYKNKL